MHVRARFTVPLSMSFMVVGRDGFDGATGADGGATLRLPSTGAAAGDNGRVSSRVAAAVAPVDLNEAVKAAISQVLAAISQAVTGADAK